MVTLKSEDEEGNKESSDEITEKIVGLIYRMVMEILIETKIPC